MNQETIDINIWDDFSDSELEEDGKKTHAYIESDLSDNDSKEVLILVQKSIEQHIPERAFDLELVFFNPKDDLPYISGEYDEDFFSPYWRIEFTNINYDNLDHIINTLQPLELTYNSIPLNIYSES